MLNSFLFLVSCKWVSLFWKTFESEILGVVHLVLLQHRLLSLCYCLPDHQSCCGTVAQDGDLTYTGPL